LSRTAACRSPAFRSICRSIHTGALELIGRSPVRIVLSERVQFSLCGGEVRCGIGLTRFKPTHALELTSQLPFQLSCCRPQLALDRLRRHQLLIQNTFPLEHPRQFIAVIKGLFQRRRLGVATLTRPVSSNPVGIRPPLPGPSALPSNCHRDIVTKRNDTFTLRVMICEFSGIQVPAHPWFELAVLSLGTS
jgi:hypothetical protein